VLLIIPTRFLAKEMKDLHKQIKRVKKSVDMRAKRVEELERICANSVNLTSMTMSTTSNSELEDLGNGKTTSYLRSKIQYVKSPYECVKCLATEVFTEQELCDCSISEKKVVNHLK
jgi:hypothetical protein